MAQREIYDLMKTVPEGYCLNVRIIQRALVDKGCLVGRISLNKNLSKLEKYGVLGSVIDKRHRQEKFYHMKSFDGEMVLVRKYPELLQALIKSEV